MTSYIPLLLKGNVYPVKVGGKVKGETPGIMSKEEEAILIKAFKEGDKKTIDQLREQVEKTAIDDIKTAYVAWIPKEISQLVPFTTKELFFVVGPGMIVGVPIKHVKKYGKPPEKPTKGPTAKITPFEVIRGPKESDKSYAKRLESNLVEDRMPFVNLDKKTLWGMLENGVLLQDKYMLSRKMRKAQKITSKTNINKTIPSHIPCTAYVVVYYPDAGSETHVFKDGGKMHVFIDKQRNENRKFDIFYPYDDGYCAGYKSGKQMVNSYTGDQKPKWKKQGVEYLSSMINPMQSGYSNDEMDNDYLGGFENGFKQAWLEQVNESQKKKKEITTKFSESVK